MATTDEHRQTRLTHRLEAFSDIVIGFSLAQLGLNLVIPAHAADFVERPFGIVAFLFTFAVVVRFWWLHARIFDGYFVPDRVLVVANFFALAVLTLQVFALQLYLHFVPLGQGIVASRIYFGLFAATYGILDAMLALGARARWKLLSPAERRWAAGTIVQQTCTVVGCLVGNVLASPDAANVLVAVAGRPALLVATLPNSLFSWTLGGSLLGYALKFVAARVRRSAPAMEAVAHGEG